MMRLFRNIALLVFFILGLTAFAQNPRQSQAVLDYIEKYKDLAMEEMALYDVPASITLAQAIVESAHGTNKLSVQGHNHFSIKCPGRVPWKGKKMYQKDDNPDDCFRVYDSDEESFRDHSLFLHQNGNYAPLFKLDITDYIAWAKGLKKAGWATDPDYPSKIINQVKVYNLTQYDQMVLKGKYKPKGKKDEPPAVKPKGAPAASPAPAPATPAAKPNSAKKKTTNVKVKTGPAPVFAECPVMAMTSGQHGIRENFGVKFIITKNGDNIDNLAKELKMTARQLRKYNNLVSAKKTFTEGEILYIGPKRFRAASGYTAHIVKQGETLSQISNIYAVRLDRLFKMNGLDENSVLHVGDTIILR